MGDETLVERVRNVEEDVRALSAREDVSSAQRKAVVADVAELKKDFKKMNDKLDVRLDGLSNQISEAKGALAILSWFKNVIAAAIGAAVAAIWQHFSR